MRDGVELVAAALSHQIHAATCYLHASARPSSHWLEQGTLARGHHTQKRNGFIDEFIANTHTPGRSFITHTHEIRLLGNGTGTNPAQV
jgi:hypothetical protein